MALVSPTPAAPQYDSILSGPIARPDIRKFPTRPLLRRTALHSKAANGVKNPQPWEFSLGDSSDDEMPVAPMKFSAEAKALLGDEASVMEISSPAQREQDLRKFSQEQPQAPKSGSPHLLFSAEVKDRVASPTASRSGSPRVVRLSMSALAPSTLRRSQSVREGFRSPGGAGPIRDLITPAPRIKNHRTGSPISRSGHPPGNNSNPHSGTPGSLAASTLRQPTSNESEQANLQETVAQMESLSINRTNGEDMGLATSQRQKRGLKVTGRFLSGPARRGLKRRQSDEDQSPVQELHGTSVKDTGSPSEQRAYQEQSLNQAPGQDDQIDHVPKIQDSRSHIQASLTTGSPDPRNSAPSRAVLVDSIEGKLASTSVPMDKSSSTKHAQPVFKMPPLPALPSRFDQENEPPPTFKRNRPNIGSYPDKEEKIQLMGEEKMLAPTPATASPKRPALAPRSQNTPHRPAPPPPKMTVLETATATAGAASASQARKKKNQYMSVNGRYFTRMDCIGRGGSSKVFRVMAENYKVFALKRVALEDQDELAIRGYKGEIDLLRKLENVDRVVRLFDYEINEDKQTLSVLMEMGESDLNRVLTQRLNAEDACLDITFTRYFWKEMLECVQAVHAHDVVHSDLKPANFLLLQGRLKLIDFGISNAIAEDTVNVHREQHIGTPNYMSPEALIDSNAAAGLPSSEGKMMKLGKPSDVWSLGCILYQMVYGKPPFAHIANQMQRIMAIPNPRHAINFPEKGIGGVLIPAGLVKTLRRCLNRDQTLRPTVDELLAFGDPFLFPDVIPSRDTVPVGQELIARLQNNIIKHIKEKGLPTDAEMATWPARFYASIKAAVEEGRA